MRDQEGPAKVIAIFSIQRVGRWTTMAGLGPNAALDLRTTSEDGVRWDFDDPKRRKDALLLVRSERPKAPHRAPGMHGIQCPAKDKPGEGRPSGEGEGAEVRKDSPPVLLHAVP